MIVNGARPTAIVVLGLLLGTPSAASAPRRSAPVVDVLLEANVRIVERPTEDVGWTVAGTGDVNGDAIPDVVIGAPFRNPKGRRHAGSAYVVFGTKRRATLNVAALGRRGFRIDGPGHDAFAGAAVAGAGDVNGDGLSDVIVGAPLAEVGADRGRAVPSGAAYVVFGKKTASPVDLAALGRSGFRIDSAVPGDRFGSRVAGAGDVNGDGRSDVVVGDPDADHNGRLSSGSAYVVFGKATTSRVGVAALGRWGFRIDGADWGHAAGRSVGGAGDVNGDGRADVIVGAPFAHDRPPPRGEVGNGTAYVVFGKATSGTVDLAAFGRGGLAIRGDAAARSVTGLGDVNGDGRADVAVTAHGNPWPAGSVHVVFGRASPGTVELARLGRGGFRVNAPALAVARAGDLNGDGRPDLLVAESDRAWVVFGKKTTGAVELAAGSAVRLDVRLPSEVPLSVSGVGDMDGDGRADLIVGIPGNFEFGVWSSASIVGGAPWRRCLVPYVLGRSLQAARLQIVRSGCTLGSVRRSATAAKVRRGRVVSQRPAPGARRTGGARVDVVVARRRR